MDYFKKLKLPDYFSLTSLFFAWLSILAIVNNSSDLSISLMLLALFFDFLDGFSARYFKMDSKKGRYLDTYIDTVSYLVFSSLFFAKFLSSTLWIGTVIGFSIVAFGTLRLLRYSWEGILTDDKGKYYRGVTVLHINFLITLGYVFKRTRLLFNEGIFAAILLLACSLMLSNYKTHKNQIPFIWLAMVLSFIFSLYAN